MDQVAQQHPITQRQRQDFNLRVRPVCSRDEKKRIFSGRLESLCETENTNFREPVVGRDYFTAGQPGGTLTPQVVGKGHGHLYMLETRPQLTKLIF